MVSRLELAEIIGERTIQVESFKELKNAIAAYLLEENDVDELDSLMRDVLAYRANHGYVEATLVSAYPLTDATKVEISDVLKAEFPKARKITMNETINPEVIGGVRIELAGEVLDLTIQAKLNTFKRLTAARKD